MYLLPLLQPYIYQQFKIACSDATEIFESLMSN